MHPCWAYLPIFNYFNNRYSIGTYRTSLHCYKSQPLKHSKYYFTFLRLNLFSNISHFFADNSKNLILIHLWHRHQAFPEPYRQFFRHFKAFPEPSLKFKKAFPEPYKQFSWQFKAFPEPSLNCKNSSKGLSFAILSTSMGLSFALFFPFPYRPVSYARPCARPCFYIARPFFFILLLLLYFARPFEKFVTLFKQKLIT